MPDPIGIDAAQPRFSWQLTGNQRNLLQSAYEIKVTAGKKIQWSSGKVSSDQSVMVSYGGDPLSSAAKYTWQVRAWDNNGKASAWSAPASFQTGFLNKSDWKAKWIGIGYIEDSINRPAQYFRKSFSTSKKIVSATAFITAHGMYEAQINGKRVTNGCNTRLMM
jgi:alpha-L-rhamnosidase